MSEKFPEKAKEILNERFHHDSLIALAMLQRSVRNIYRVKDSENSKSRTDGARKEILQIVLLHLTEGRNTGFKKILDALERNGSPKPEFETDDDRSYFITRLFIHEKFADVSNNDPKRSRKKELKERVQY